jgi:hypothetical protein
MEYKRVNSFLAQKGTPFEDGIYLLFKVYFYTGNGIA